MPPSSRKNSAGILKRALTPLPAETPQGDADLREIDALFAAAGLARNRRDKPAGVKRRARFQGKTPEELRPAPAQVTTAANGVLWVGVPAWQKLPWLWHGFATRQGGVSSTYAREGEPAELNLGFTPDDPRPNVLRNRELLAQAITGSASTPISTLHQIHSTLVLALKGPSGRLCKGDGHMTRQQGILLGVQTADCIPVLVADKRKKVVAAFHAGWRGTVNRIVEKGIGRMRLEYGSRPEDLIAAIGPGIGPCCYAVGEEVDSAFESQFHYAAELFHEVYDTDPVRTRYPMLFLTQRAPGHSDLGPSLHLDLFEANRRQLLDAGLKPSAIQRVGGCTACQTGLFFSHRSSKGRCGRMLAVIGVRKKE